MHTDKWLTLAYKSSDFDVHPSSKTRKTAPI